jgi:DNA replication factor GINS
MDIEELRAVQSRERSSSELQELRDSFYADVAEYLDGLREERERLARECEDPYDDSVIRVNDEIDAAERVVKSIHERRVGKVVEQASFTANGLGDAPAGLTAEERALFEDLVDRIEANTHRVLDIVRGEVESPALPSDAAAETTDPASDTPEDPGPEVEEVPPEEPTTDAAELMDDSVPDGGGTGAAAADPEGGPTADAEAESDQETAESTDVDRERLRIVDDVGEIYGIDDRVYDLRKDDVVTLPSENAGPLLERGAAERLE